MKKVLFILIAFVVLASAFGFQAGPAKAAGLITYVDGRFIWHKGVVFVFDASWFSQPGCPRRQHVCRLELSRPELYSE